MPTISSGWMGGEGQAATLTTLVGYKSVSTGTITRGTSTAATKTVRLETLASQRQFQGDNGMTYLADAYILAAYGTDLRVGDRFTVNGQKFEVIMVMPGLTDCVQCYLRLRA